MNRVHSIEGAVAALLFSVAVMEAPAQTTGTVTHDAALHHTWSSASAVDGHVQSGDAVAITSQRAGYSHVTTAAGTRGWVYAHYINTGAAPASVVSGGTTPVVPATTPAGGVASSLAAVEALAKTPKGTEKEYPGCPSDGLQSGPQQLDVSTNVLKNRIDDGPYTEVSFATMLALPWQGMPTKRFAWLHDDTVRTMRYESAAVSVVGYLVDAHPEGKESTNCSQTSGDWVDWHMWLVETQQEAKDMVKKNAIVIELTPRARKEFAARFDSATIMGYRHGTTKLRISGWLMLDPDHPSDATGTANKKPSRGTIWEIHPVMKIEPVP